MPWALSDIRSKVRQVTGRLSINQLSNNRLDTYINNYYQYTFSAETKLEREHTYYTFYTAANQEQYDLPDTLFTNFEPLLTLDGFRLEWYQDPNVFFQQNPQQYTQQTPWAGNGTTTIFSTTIQTPSIVPGSLIVTDNTETFIDDGSGILVSDTSPGGSGTVNYTTGVISVTFFVAPANGQDIFLSFVGYTARRPRAVLMYNNVFRFAPIPDTVYRAVLQAYRIEQPMLLATDTPRLQEWGPAIAYGASRDIFADFGEIDRIKEFDYLYNEQIDYVLRSTHQNLLNTRSKPMF